MPTKFPRRSCICCKRKLVSWKMPAIQKESGVPVTFLCWDCARRYYLKLERLNILDEPSKKDILKNAYSIPKKPKQERF